MKKVVQFLIVAFVVISIVSQLLVEVEQHEKDTSSACGDHEQLDTLASWNVIKRVRRSWIDYYQSIDNCVSYELSSSDHDAATDFRKQMRSPRFRSDDEYWGKVYARLYERDREQMKFLEDSIRVAIQMKGYTEVEAIHYIVSLVQDIPYHYIMTESCQGFNDHPCVPMQRFGLLSPVEFLYTLTGDCDTRTVLLYTLLSNMGYRSVIVNSVQYGHSMLAVSMPSGGDYLEHRGERFFFWETTATGWAPGTLPPDMNNVNYWNVVLDDQTNP